MSGKISLLLITPSIASTTFMVLLTFQGMILMPYFLWRIVCKVSKVNWDESVKHSNFHLALNLLSNKNKSVENFREWYWYNFL